jgi:hypothetical protein
VISTTTRGESNGIGPQIRVSNGIGKKMCSNFATRMQEARLHSQNILFVPCLVCSPQVRVCRVPMDKGFPCAIAL